MTTRRHNTIVLSVALSVSVLLILVKRKDPEKFSSRTFRSSVSGWGYDILVEGKLLIHQESIPVLTGRTGFPEKEQAERTATLIINKMKKGRLPTVTTFELEQIFPLNDMEHERSAKTQ